ncbi:hypothetical protein JQ633_13570 [Bradyrhizobium tropiciagri]|uniref:hypothetical protein n=1 Tax=Bradyrhizobium tropiciagri TaxID=312253 RepID=UPI001BAE3E3C|nr:hypothetical protein [Bradyrhizobium tropiciagri]MBR0871391.1 hypothetical protein [Bradyrhizobium tropiciagri]
MDLFLRPIVIAGDKLNDDFVVVNGDRHVGRIRLASERKARVWVYIITVPLPIPAYENGRAHDLEEAKASFRAAWERFYSGLTPDSMEHWHRHGRGG